MDGLDDAMSIFGPLICEAKNNGSTSRHDPSVSMIALLRSSTITIRPRHSCMSVFMDLWSSGRSTSTRLGLSFSSWNSRLTTLQGCIGESLARNWQRLRRDWFRLLCAKTYSEYDCAIVFSNYRDMLGWSSKIMCSCQLVKLNFRQAAICAQPQSDLVRPAMKGSLQSLFVVSASLTRILHVHPDDVPIFPKSTGWAQ